MRIVLITFLLSLAACGGSSGPGETGNPSSGRAGLSDLAALGEKIFHDPSLSASGQQACSTCHDPAQGFAQASDSGVSAGGKLLDLAGLRNAPSLTYLLANPPFYFDDEGTPTGGFDRDGRAQDFADQSRRPFLTPFEMGNRTIAEVTDKLSRAGYEADFRALFGDSIFSGAGDAFDAARQALQAYEREAPEFAPYTSRYDYFLAGRATLTDRQMRGLALYNDPKKGNCVACHPSGRGADRELPLFTDFTYDNLGVPRNGAINANANPDYFDLGLCGPQRTDLADRADLCGAFKVPSLRNVALTAPYFHNGRFQTLEEVVGFYVRRDTDPGEWYPLGADGLPRKFDDLPPQYARNVNTTEAPYNRAPGQSPALTPAEIGDVVAFLQTLTDGYQP